MELNKFKHKKRQIKLNSKLKKKSKFLLKMKINV